ATMYSSGLRVSEVCHLRYEDIRRKQMMIHVPLSKNRQDRYTILSDRNLEILTEYWYSYNRPMGWLFQSTVRDEPLTSSNVQLFIKKSCTETRASGRGNTAYNEALLCLPRT
ncbi:tyrosine-type recombinase/integrase, partial [Bariatricus sp. HCP28S3_E2]